MITRQSNDTVMKEALALAERHGVTIAEVSDGHYHVEGKLLVNWWPFSKKQSAHVQGSRESLACVGANDVVRMACGRSPEEWSKVLNDASIKKVMGPNWKPSQQNFRKPAGERLSRNEYAYRRPDYDQHAAHVAASQTPEHLAAQAAGRAPW